MTRKSFFLLEYAALITEIKHDIVTQMKFLRIEILVLHKIKKVSAIKKISLASLTAYQIGLCCEQ